MKKLILFLLLTVGIMSATSAQTNCATQSVKFVNGKLYSGTANNVNAVYRYYNVATDNVTGVQVNATVTIASLNNAVLETVDNDGADSDGQDRKNLFAPRISPNSELNSVTKSGYAEFIITFYKNKNTNSNSNDNYSELISLSDLNYVHYDIDGNSVTTGSANSRYEFREVGQVDATIPSVTVFANSPTELTVNNSGNWKGYRGSTIEKPGISTVPEVVAAFRFSNSRSSISVRMGYEYTYLGTGNNNNSGWNTTPVREFGTTFSCFLFPKIVGLPVKFLNIETFIDYDNK